MIVCVCRRVSDRAIRQAAEEGVDSFEDLQAWTGLGTQCGCCRQVAGEIFEAARHCAPTCAPTCATTSAKTCAGRAAGAAVVWHLPQAQPQRQTTPHDRL